MNTPWLEQLNEVQASAIASAVSLADLATRNAANLTRHEMELLSEALEECVANMQVVGHATSLQQVFDRQHELVESCAPQFAALANDQVRLLLEMQGSWTAWLQERVEHWPIH